MLQARQLTGGRKRGRGRGGWLLAAAAAGTMAAFVGFYQVNTTDGEMRARSAPGALQPASWPADAITIAYLGHATLLIDFLGVRVITDPTFFHRVGLDVGDLFTIGPVRQAPVPLLPAALPQLDAILITHAHMDHLDIPSLEALPKSATVVSCPGCRDLIAPLGYEDVRPLTWGESTTVRGLRITAMGARHWGRRWPWEADRGYNSYVIEKDGWRMLIACDSAYTPLFGALKSDPPLIAAFSIGAYNPWIGSHANPEQVWAMFRATGARYLIPIHWGTFRLSKEPLNEPIHRLLRDAGPMAGRIVIRRIGGFFQVSAPSLHHASLPSTSGAKVFHLDGKIVRDLADHTHATGGRP